VDKKGDGEASPPIGTTVTEGKAPLVDRFLRDVKRIIFCSWVNWLLLFVPVGIILGILVDWAHVDVVSPSVVFAINAVAIIPLASLLAYATESVAVKLGDTIGALLNVTFGNAVELIIFIIALVANEIRVVQAAALGSILANLLLILGMCFAAGGLRFREQLYNSTVSQMSACLLCLSVISLLLPVSCTPESFLLCLTCQPDGLPRLILQHHYGRSRRPEGLTRHQHRASPGLPTISVISAQVSRLYVSEHASTSDRRGVPSRSLGRYSQLFELQ
jgi:hypothetical protein